jgi:hypothetical protein
MLFARVQLRTTGGCWDHRRRSRGRRQSGEDSFINPNVQCPEISGLVQGEALRVVDQGEFDDGYECRGGSANFESPRADGSQPGSGSVPYQSCCNSMVRPVSRERSLMVATEASSNFGPPSSHRLISAGAFLTCRQPGSTSAGCLSLTVMILRLSNTMGCRLLFTLSTHHLVSNLSKHSQRNDTDACRS